MKLSREELRKRRCYYGALGNEERLGKFDAEDVIIKSFVTTTNPAAQRMAQMYEKLLAMCTIDFKTYCKSRDNLQLQIAKYIHENKLYREWVDLGYIVSRTSMHRVIADAYVSEIMETWNYLTNYESKTIYGVTRDNELLIRPAIHADWDAPLHELHYQLEQKRISPTAFQKKLSALYERNQGFGRDENITDICIFGMLPFINERTKSIFPNKWFSHGNYKLAHPRKWKDTSFYKEQLKIRKFLLDKKGVKIFLNNAGSFSEALFMEDVTKDNKLVMLFRLSDTSGGSTMGFYHLEDNFFFTPFCYTDEGQQIHLDIENFILELYTELVCGLEKDKKRIYALKEVDDINHIENFRDTHVYIQVQGYNEITDDDELKGNRKSGYSVKPHERRFALRKLRPNQKPSEEATQRALEYGIELQEGYTFVRSYEVGKTANEVRRAIPSANKD